MKQLSQSGVDVNDTFDANINPSHAGITPLALACALNLVDVVGVRCNFNSQKKSSIE